MSSSRSTLLVLAIIAIAVLPAIPPHKPAAPKTTLNVPSSPTPGPYGKLYDLWNGNAYFERSKYDASIRYDEQAPIARPDKGPNTIYMYYRDHGPNNRNDGVGIGLTISNDNGASFTPYPSNPVVPLGGTCDWDNNYVVAPSVVYAPKSPSGYQYYMVYEGSAASTCTIGLGKVGLATSSDGVTWTKSASSPIIQTDSSCNNVGTPFIGYFSNTFYVFYHQNCGPANDLRNKIMMASGSDPTNLVKRGLVMDIGNGDSAWDSRTNSRASVVSEVGSDGVTYYYLAFEGAQSVYCLNGIGGISGSPIGNWGWGLARTSNIDSGPWQKFAYNPIRQTYNGGCQNDIPYLFQYGGAIRVYQYGQGLSNVLLSGSKYSSTIGPKSVTVNHPGGDPYLYVFPARSQCSNYNNNLGRLDGDGISWSVNTIDDGSKNAYMCYGPYASTLTAGNYAVDWNLWIDINTCPCGNVVGLDFTNPGTNFGVNIVTRDKFQYAKTFQAFHNQFAASASTAYEWRTYWYGTSYLKQRDVVLRYLDGADTTPPTTTMSPLPTNSQSPFTVSWSGSDTGSGIWQYDVQYQDNGGAWTNWPAATATGSTSATFTLSQCSHTYGFQARARDNAGNLGSYSSAVSTFVSCGSFTLSGSPTSLTITAGSEQHDTVIVNSVNGFTGTVHVTATPSSSAISCWFSGGASSDDVFVPAGGSGSTLPACTGAPAGSYGVTFIGTSGSLSSSVNVPITITDFGISAPDVSVPSGSSTSGTVSLMSLQGFSGTVSLGAPAPVGLTVSCPPSATIASGGSATPSCTYSSSTPGTYTVTITGTYNPTGQYYNALISHSTSITVTIINPDFSLSASSPAAVIAGTSPSSTITVSSIGGFANPVTLTITTIPAGLYCQLITPGTVTPPGPATLSCSSGTSGAYTVTITGTSGSLSHSTTATYTFTDFSVSSNFNNNPPLNQNTQITYQVSVGGINGFSNTVNLSVTMYACQSSCSDGLLPVASWADTGSAQTTAQPASCPSSSCLRSLTVASYNAVGQFMLGILGTCSGCGPGATSHYLFNYFWIQCNPMAGTPPANFCLWVQSGSLAVPQSGIPGDWMYLDSNGGYTGTVTLQTSVSGCNSGCGTGTTPSVVWNDTRTTQTSVTLNPNASSCYPGPYMYCAQKLLIVYAGTQTGDFTVTVTGICPASACTTSQSHFVQIDLQIFASGGGGGGSVAAGTWITLADGSQVPAQNLQVGMKLLSYDMATHQYVTTTITRYFSVVTNNQMEIYTGTGKPLIVDQNPAQQLYVMLPSGKITLMSVTKLQVGYRLFEAISQQWVAISALHYQNGGSHVMYDIYTTAPGNYIANGILDPLKM